MMAKDISILGIYTSKFGELWDKSLEDLLYEAIGGVLKNSLLEPGQIDAMFVANMASGSFNNQRHINALASQYFAHFPPSYRLEGACASGGLAVESAILALLSGIYRTVLVVGVEKMTDFDAPKVTDILATAAHTDSEYGSTFAGLYALLAEAHTQKFGTTRDQLSAVAVKNHMHALKNPNAQFQKEITLEQVNDSVLVSSPLRLLDCSPISDGSAAVILSIENVKNKPKFIGFGHGQDTIDLAGRSDLTELKATKIAANNAYTMSGLTPQDIAVAEVHDCFTIAEILATEDLGFFAKGMGGAAVVENKTTFGGTVVVNPSGGLKACGHPIGATGVKQIATISELIAADQYRVGLTHNVGGSGATAVVHIISK